MTQSDERVSRPGADGDEPFRVPPVTAVIKV